MMGMMNARILLPSWMAFLAAGCALAPISPTPTAAATDVPCTEAGTVRRVAIDSTTDVFVYLPPCYDSPPDHRYPVVYLFPGFGGTNHDFFNLGAANIADELIQSRQTPPFLIVTTADIFPDVDARIVTETILPYIEANYRARPERLFRAAAGGSFGGAVAYHLAFKRYDLFGSAGIFGNGAAAGEEGEIQDWLAAIPKDARPRVFLNVGEGDTYMLERAKVLVPLLDEAGILHEEIFSPGGHAGDYWVSNFAAYFLWMSSDWRQ
jgi:enterochelin esterase family protein